jgi:hypothetical protein
MLELRLIYNIVYIWLLERYEIKILYRRRDDEILMIVLFTSCFGM